MKHILKKSLSVILAFAIIFSSAYVGLGEVDWGSLLIIETKAASESDLTFTLNEDGESYSVTDCDSSSSGELVIPSLYNGLPVTSIGNSAFSFCSGLTSVVIPNSVTSIGNGAFNGCSGISSITIPDSVTSIGSEAFFSCASLTSITIPDSVTDIGRATFAFTSKLSEIKVGANNPNFSSVDGVLLTKDKTTLIAYPAGKEEAEYIIPDSVTTIDYCAFYVSNLETIIIPESVTCIENGSFFGCSDLKTITIPDSVTTIGSSAFSGCTSLKDVYYSGTEADWVAISIGSNNEALTGATIHYATTSQGFEYTVDNNQVTITDYIGADTEIIIPSSINGLPVTSIGNSAFSFCSGLTSVVIPNSVISIGASAFEGCSSLTSIEIPESVTSIGRGAFLWTDKLSAINVETSNSNFSSVDGVLLTKDKTTLIAYPKGKEETEYIIPDSVTTIGYCAFYVCSRLNSIIIPDSVTTIGEGAFFACSGLNSIIIPDSVTRIDIAAFTNSSLAYVFYTGTEEQWGSITIASDNTSLTSAKLHYEVTDHTYGENVYDCSTATKTNECVICGHIKSEAFVVEDLLTFTLSEDSTYYSITDCDTSVEGKIILHSEYNGLPITNIGSSAFKGCTSVTSITVPDSVTNIGNYAFENCSSLASISLPDSVTNIGDYAFENCSSLTSIKLPANITEIGVSVFNGCSSLVVITIPNKVTSIGSSAFEGCTALTSVTIPNSVTSIGSAAFEGCTRLTSITLPDTGLSIYEQAFNNTGYYNDENNWENDVIYIGNHLIKAKATVSGDYTIKTGTKTIASNAFEECANVESVIVPDSVERIGSSAFSGCTSLETVTISDGVEYIGSSVFLGCTGLKSLTIPESVISIGSNAFKDCLNIEELYLGNNKAVSAFVFTELKKLTKVVLGNGVTNIYNSTFKGCTNLKFLTISESVSYISSNAFVDCVNIEELYLGNDVAVSAFVFNQLEKLTVVTFGNGVTNIPDSAFNGCVNLETVTISDSVKTVGDSAFYGCSSLSIVEMGNAVTSIGDSAFYDCKSLAKFVIPDSVQTIGSHAFYGCKSLSSIRVPEGVKTIEYGVFSGCESLTSVAIPDTVTSIGSQAFYNCRSLKNAVIPEGVTAINDYIFYCCESLTSVTVPDSVIAIGEYAFYGCNELEVIKIPEGVTQINNGTFCGCQSLNSITIPDTVTKICDSAFYNCSGLETIELSKNLTSIGDYAFHNCGFSSVELPNEVKTIGDYAFHHSKINSIAIPESVTSIGDYAFYCCSSLESIDVAEANPVYSSIDGVLFSENRTILIKFPERKRVGFYTIPDTVTTFSDDAFDYVLLDVVVLGSGLQNIKADAFSMCSIMLAIVVPVNVTSIGSDALGSINEVLYEGTQEQWNAIDVSGLSCRVHYNVDINAWDKHIGDPVYYCLDTRYTCSCGYEIGLPGCPSPEEAIHNLPDEWIVENEPTCTSEGYRYKYCLDCGTKIEETIPTTHVLDWYPPIDPNCTNDGHCGKWCIYCYEIFEQEIIPATGHNYSDWNVVVEATCTQEGQRIKNCINYTGCWGACSDVVEEVIPATGHTVSQWNIETEASCSQEGFKWGYCDSCGEYLEETTPKTHIINDWDIGTEATCTNEGCRYGYCDTCGGYVEETIPATGHSYSTEWTIDVKATCTEDGSKSHHCLNCESKTDVTVISATGHDYKFNNTLSVHPHTKTYKCSLCEGEKTEKSTVSNCVECNFTITAADSSSYKLVSYIGVGIDVTIPSSYNERAITMISNGCFKGKTSIKSVTIAEGVTSIGSLAFMNCTSLEKVVIPASVTTIGANAFYGFTGTIYCMNGSFAHEYAVANNIDYVVMSIVGKGDTHIDFNNFLIRTGVQNCKDILDILGVSETAMALAVPSYTYGSLELLGTGTTVSVFDGADYIGDFTLIVEGDTNGDSVCDALDAWQVSLASNGHETLDGAYAMAADSNSDDVVDITDYQAIVNKAVS